MASGGKAKAARAGMYAMVSLQSRQALPPSPALQPERAVVASRRRMLERMDANRHIQWAAKRDPQTLLGRIGRIDWKEHQVQLGTRFYYPEDLCEYGN